jgi:hypothetical protein
LVTTSAFSAPAGQTYFISDGTPIENFDFFRPLALARKRQFPTFGISTHTAHCLSWLLEDVYHISKLLSFPIYPLLTRAEVFKVGVTHYFSIDKAKKELGYAPKITSSVGALRIAKYYQRHYHTNDYFQFAHYIWYVLILAGMILLGLVAFKTTDYTDSIHHMYLLAPVEWLALAIFRTRFNLQMIFYAAVGVHVFEGLYAYSIARSFCKNTAELWLLQTTVLGFPSLRLLLDKVQMEKKE